MYAFFVGFVVSAMWGQIGNADSKARIEGAAAVQLANDLTVFDKADGDRVRQSLVDFENAALMEWPLAASGQSYPEADSALRRLYTAYTQSSRRTRFKRQSSVLLSQTSTRSARREQNGCFRPAPTLGRHGRCGRSSSSPAHWSSDAQSSTASRIPPCTTPWLEALLVATNLFLVLELSHPFVGEMATSPEPLRQAVSIAASN